MASAPSDDSATNARLSSGVGTMAAAAAGAPPTARPVRAAAPHGPALLWAAAGAREARA